MKSTPVKKNKKIIGELNKSFPIVAIGASAGGLEAFIQVVSNIPAGTGMAFVLIQHLDPTHASLSVDIISKSSQLEIEEAKDGTRIEPNHIYVNPPNYNMSISGGVLKLSLRDELVQPHLSIDYFFQSLALSEKKRAIGVVLSGTGADGTMGMWAIKAEGGVTYAQEPSSAKYPAMPQNAIASGVVDLVLTPIDIVKELIRLSTHSYLTTDETSDESTPDKALTEIFSLIQRQMKVDFAGYKHTTIKRRIERRMMVNKTKTVQDYMTYLKAHKEEVLALYDDLLINVTEFFRDPETFISLTKYVFPALIKARPDEQSIRIWIPGCSTGEEVYSIAMVLTEYLQKNGRQNQIQIFATDISEPAIHKARLGQYSENISENVSKERLKMFFDKTESGYKINKRIRDLCLFSRHDVTGDPPFAKLDLISCRNLLIYFATPLQKRIIPMFHYGLRPGGFLVLGKSESPGEFSKLFTSVEKTHKIYSKSDTPTPVKFLFRPLQREPAIKATEIFPHLEIDFHKDVDKILLSRFAPPGVIVNSHFEILQFRGRTVPFLEPASGKPSLNLLKMVRPELLPGLRKAFQSLAKGNKSLQEGLSFESHGEEINVDIEVLSISPKEKSKDGPFLVLFKESLERVKSKAQSTKKKATSSTAKDRQIAQLLKELSDIKDYQETLVEQYEASQEELTSANEELQSANEEFQSTNEEIETSQEELQSTNEELVTVNDELQIRNSDLSVLSGDLNNLLTSIEIPVLIVGSNHCIRMFSPRAKQMFNLIHSDIGRPMSDIKSNFNLDMSSLVNEVSETLILKEVELQDNQGHWQRVQVRPYRTVDNRIDGVVISLMDISLLKQKEIKIKEHLEHLTSVAEAVPIPLAVINHEFQLESANHSFYKYFQVSEKSVGKNFFDSLKMHDSCLVGFKTAFFKLSHEDKMFVDLEIDCEVPDLGVRKILCSGARIHGSEIKVGTSLISFIDITQQRLFEEERKYLLQQEKEARRLADHANRSKDIFLATVTHELRTPLTSILSWAQLIVSGKLDAEKIKQGALVIERSAKVQNQLIDDLLDISRIIMGKLGLKISLVDPRIAIRSAIDSVHSIAEKKSIEIECHLGDEAALIHADLTRLQQIIWNLLTNAIKFSFEKSRIVVELKHIKEKDRPFIQITVQDFGKGISEEFLPHIFSQFSQADSASTRVHGGLGLGLSIVHKLVELQAGTVRVQNVPNGAGVIFTVIFPEVSDQSLAILPTESPKQLLLDKKDEIEIVVPKLDGIKILAVDDDGGTREAISIYLKSFGAEVLDVGSASEALVKLETFKPDILISDIAMPFENGYDLIKKIRSLSPDRGGTVPAIALTAYATEEDSERALAADFQAHIGKPVEANNLGQIILKVLANSGFVCKH
jgi:two-component system CheB/CheR fusion protein